MKNLNETKTDGNIILIYKGYDNLKKDILNAKKNFFLYISKIPDIYYNIKLG